MTTQHCTRCLRTGHTAANCKHPLWAHAAMGDDHTEPGIDPLIAGQWAAALITGVAAIGFVIWCIRAVFHVITGA